MQIRHKEGLNEEIKLLRRYLEQYRNCRSRIKTLQARQAQIRRDFEASPLSSMNYDGMPKGNKISVGAASLAYMLDEIDIRIEEQKERASKVLINVMDIISFLPENEIERDILEARYIDCHSWTKTCRIVCLTRTPADQHLNKGLYRLLEFGKVQKILADYKEELEKKDYESNYEIPRK